MNTFDAKNNPNADGELSFRIASPTSTIKDTVFKKMIWALTPEKAAINEIMMNTFFGGPDNAFKSSVITFKDFHLASW